MIDLKRKELEQKWASQSATQQKANREAFSRVARAIEDNLDDPQKLRALIHQLEIAK
jgi:hypothetical protein